MLKIRTLCIFHLKTSAYRRDFEKNYVIFERTWEILLEKYNEIWGKVSNIIEKEFESKSVYNEKYIKVKWNFLMEKSTNVFKIIKNQKKALDVFVYQ